MIEQKKQELECLKPLVPQTFLMEENTANAQDTATHREFWGYGFDKWLDTLIEEKELDTNHTFEVEGASGPNLIPLAVVIEHIKIATKREQVQIKNTLVKIDFANGSTMHFFEHLAKAIAI